MALKNTVIDALIERWNDSAKKPEVMDGSESARESNARWLGRLEGIKLCADQLGEVKRLLADEDATYLADIDRCQVPDVDANPCNRGAAFSAASQRGD